MLGERILSAGKGENLGRSIVPSFSLPPWPFWVRPPLWACQFANVESDELRLGKDGAGDPCISAAGGGDCNPESRFQTGPASSSIWARFSCILPGTSGITLLKPLAQVPQYLRADCLLCSKFCASTLVLTVSALVKSPLGGRSRHSLQGCRLLDCMPFIKLWPTNGARSGCDC